MSTYKSTGAPVAGSVADRVSRLLHKGGPMAEADLFLAIDFGCVPSKRYERLNRVIGTGWIVHSADGRFDCSAAARAYYDALDDISERAKPIGQIAASRQPENVFDRPPLNRKYIPSRRGIRADIPDWSQRPAAQPGETA